MKIRKARPSDLKEYVRLRREILEEYADVVGKRIKFSRSKVEKEFLDFAKSRRCIALVAEENSRPIGFVLATFEDLWQKSLYIDYIFVAAGYRRKGAGTALVKKLVEVAKKKGIKRCRVGVNLKNKRAISFYRKLGFEAVRYEMDLNIK